MAQAIDSSRREREDDGAEEPASKRMKPDEGDNGMAEDSVLGRNSSETDPSKSKYILEDLLPPSRSLLPSQGLYERREDQINFTMEADVGITEYVGREVPPIQGIIKQR
jgi:tRNA pseudouridine13 synthase